MRPVAAKVLVYAGLGYWRTTYPGVRRWRFLYRKIRLLGGHPRVGARQLDGYVGKGKAKRLAVGCAAVVGRDEQGAGLLVVRPGCDDNARFLRSATAVDKFPHPVVRADEQLPGIARRVADI